jgi:DNA-binding NtrC family response regulator
MVSEGQYRSDLYWRLNVIPIAIPPLRKRKEDIPPLVGHFIEKFNRKNARQLEGISREALDHIMKKPLEGNVRELENLIERATVLARGNRITLHDLPESAPEETETAGEREPEQVEHELSGRSYDENMRVFETRLITQALGASDWNQSEAARRLGIGERKLRSRMEILGIEKPA